MSPRAPHCTVRREPKGLGRLEQFQEYTGRKMLGAQCVCEKKGLGVQKYRSALQGNPFTFSCKEAVELQGCRYRCPSFLPRKNEPVWSVMDYAAGALAVPSRDAQPFSSRGCRVVYRRLVIPKCLRVGFPRVAWLPLPHGMALHRWKGAGNSCSIWTGGGVL